MRVSLGFITALHRVALFAALVLTSMVVLTSNGTSGEDSSGSPPDFTLSIPASFARPVMVKHWRKGEDILNQPPFHLVTAAPMTEYYGRPTAYQAHPHAWQVRVYATLNPKVVAAYAKARDGFEAGLDEGQEFFGAGKVATFGVFARFRKKHFRWGDAVSFLHTDYQDGPDGGARYVPDNNHLSYEVWGVTRDQQYTVVAWMSVSHPKLANWPEVRIAKNIEALKQDRDYKLIETCSPKQFEPNLTAFDQLVDSLKIR